MMVLGDLTRRCLWDWWEWGSKGYHGVHRGLKDEVREALRCGKLTTFHVAATVTAA